METIINMLGNWIIHLISAGGYAGVFVAMAIESAGIPLPSEIIMPFSGYLVWSGRFLFWMVVWMGALGNVAGSWIGYAIGKYGGRPLLQRYGKYVLVTEGHIRKGEDWFRKYGEWAVFTGRVIPVVRTFISIPAGVASMPLIRFTVYTFLGSLPWSWLLTLAGVRLGAHWSEIRSAMHGLDTLVIAVVVAAVLYWIVRVASRSVRR